MQALTSFREYLRSGGTRFGFTVANYAGDDQVRVVHNRAKGDAERVTEFSTFMNTSRGSMCNGDISFRTDVAKERAYSALI